MVASELENSNVIQLEEEVEGEHEGSDDFFFVNIGQPVPILAGDTPSPFDSQRLPSQPLAVSERFALLFVAHFTGFCVARTKDVLESAKKIEDKGSGLSIQELSVVDVPLGNIHILALSSNSSTLAASVDCDIHFFSVTSLLNKEQKPILSCSLDNASCVKDLRWIPKLENYYVVLSNCGKLYYGDSQGPLKYVMDNVDAVEWSTKGNFVAMARKNVLSILSSEFKLKLSISLLFKSFTSDSDTECIIRVDSIRWVRSDCIILGCFQLTADGKEKNYLVQVITSKNGKITDASSKLVMVYFNDVFEDLNEDIVPIGKGPHLFLSYLQQCELAIAANRKSTAQQLTLICWSMSDEKKEAAVIDLLGDSWLPRIELQGSGDDNSILALSVDKVFNKEKVKIKNGGEEKELLPYCILMCLTIEGKLIMFHVTSPTSDTIAPGVESTISDEEEHVPAMTLSEQGPSNVIRGFPGQNVQEEVRTVVNVETLKSDWQQRVPDVKLNEDACSQKSSVLEEQGTNSERLSFKTSLLEDPRTAHRDLIKTGIQKESTVISNTVSLSEEVLTDNFGHSSHMGSQKGVEIGKKSPQNIASTSLQIAASQSFSSGKLNSSEKSDRGSSLLPFRFVQGNDTSNFGTLSNVVHVPEQPTGKNFYSAAVSSMSVNSSGRLNISGQRASSGVGNIQSLSDVHGAQLPLQGNYVAGKSSNLNFYSRKENSGTSSPAGLSKSEVVEMAKELDVLLDCIERPGGFKDACTIFQESSVVALEKGLKTLSDRSRIWMSKMDEGLKNIQQLLDKTVRVLARKIYVEGIVKQATDSQYWDLWDRQKLSSELELKNRHVLKLNQELTNELIELERHFNTLELNKFGEKIESQLGQRTSFSRYGPSRYVRPVHSLHNAMSSQLAAAEQLSQRLSEQMAALCVESVSPAKKNLKRELFESIGIHYDSASFSSSDEKEDNAESKRLNIPHSAAVGDQSRRNQSSAVKSIEQESARRRRDSLDMSLVRFEPPKTTVKRMLSQEELQKRSGNRSSLSINQKHLDTRLLEESVPAQPKFLTSSSTIFHSSDYRGTPIPSRQASETQSSHSLQLRSSVMQVSSEKSFPAFSSQFMSHSSPFGGENSAQRSNNSTDGKPSSVKLPVNNFKPIQQSETSLHHKPSVPMKLFTSTISSRPQSNELLNSNIKETPSFGSVKQSPATTERSSVPSGRSSESPFLPVPALDTANSLPFKTFKPDAATNKSQHGNVAVSSSSSLSAPPFSLPATSAAPSSSTTMSVGSLLTKSKVTTDVNQTVSNTYSSTFSSPKISSAPFLQVPEKLLPPSFPPLSMTSTSGTPKTVPQPQTAKLNSEEEDGTVVTTIKPPELPSGTFSLGVAASAPPAPRSDPTMNLQSVSEVLTDGMANKGSNPELGQTPAAPIFSSSALSFSESTAGRKDESSSVAVTEDDDMEEEVSETSQTTELTLGNLGGFGIGSTPNPAASRPNPFGSTFSNASASPISSPFTMAVPTGEVLRPASFTLPSAQPLQSSPVTNFGAFSGGFSPGTSSQISTGSGFGQLAQIGPGQQALGTVLGSFGQSRQLGAGLAGSSVASVGGLSGGFAGTHSNSGSLNSGGGGGFASIASAGVGFASLASTGGGFASLASGVGGFTGMGSGGGGFAAATAAASGFSVAGSGLGAFSNQQGSGGFAAFGSGLGGGTGGPPATLFTEMRK